MKRNAFVNYGSNVLIFILLCSIILFSFSGEGISVSSFSEQPIYGGNKEGKEISLMINVYWGTEYLEGILKLLDDYSIKTTFFVGGVWAISNEELLKDMSNRGHEIGNHAYSHKDLAKLSYDAIKTELTNTNTLIESVTGKKVTSFTPPSGSFSKNTLKVSSELGMKTYMWTKDTIDWRDKDVSVIKKRATNKVGGGDVILMHPTKCTLEALPAILKHYKDNDLRVVPINKLIK